MGRLPAFSVEFFITAVLFLKIVTFSITLTFFTSLRPYKNRICRQLLLSLEGGANLHQGGANLYQGWGPTSSHPECNPALPW